MRKTGERPQVRQPLKIDKLPVELRDRIQAERAAGGTWEEIEELSPKWKEWEAVPEKVRQLFPDLKLPHTTLARWYDLRVDQVIRENLERAQKAREAAAIWAGRDFKDLPAATRNALGDQIFALMQSADKQDQQQFRKELMVMMDLLNESRKLDIKERQQTTNEKALELKLQQMKRQVDKETSDAAKKLGKGKAITTDDINRIRERTFGLPPIQPGAASGHSA